MNSPDIKKYLGWIDEGISFSLLRDDLVKTGFSDAEIKLILQRIDQEHQVRAISELNKRQGMQFMIAGALLVTCSLGLFLVSFLPIVFFAYGGVASGLGMIVWGRMMIKRTTLKQESKRESFKRRS